MTINTLSLGEGVTSIDEASFYRNQLSGELVIPSSVTSIGSTAFGGYFNKISKLTFENGSKLETIGQNAFEYNSLSGELVIPSGITRISEYSFYDNQISELSLRGNSLLNIGNYAFSNAYGYENTLATINVNMTETVFANVTKGTSWYIGTPTFNYLS